jgi:hypothetical protein
VVSFPTPVKVIPLQQNRYCPVKELNSNTVVGLPSSCRQTSKVVIVKLQVAVLPEASVAAQVTVVVPTGKQEPAGGLHTAVTPGQLSLAVGAGKFTTWHGVPGGEQTAWLVTAVWLGGQVIVGGCVSLTVTVNEQLGPPEEVQFTVVVPTGKNEPEAGEQLIVPHEPLGVGAG